MGEKHVRTDRETVIVQSKDGQRFSLTKETPVYEVTTQSGTSDYSRRCRYHWEGKPVSDLGGGRFEIHVSTDEVIEASTPSE